MKQSLRWLATSLTHQTVALHGGADLLAARRDGEGALGLDAVLQRLLHQARRATHVLVAAVRAAADQTCKRAAVVYRVPSTV